MKTFIQKVFIRKLLPVWAVWAVLLVLFQWVSSSRINFNTVDRVFRWTTGETGISRPRDRYYLNHKFMNQQVNMDSEFYLSIALGGYDDKLVRKVQDPRNPARRISLNYAFFPLYPFLIKIVSWPFRIAGLNALSTAVLTGVLISLLSALVAGTALYLLFRQELGEKKAEAVFYYFLIYPPCFFLGQIYTEALFCALAFTALYFLKKEMYLQAAVLSAFAVFTRGVGIVLFPVICLSVLYNRYVNKDWKEDPVNKIIIPLLSSLIPLAAYFLWRFVFGRRFDLIHENFFGRGFLKIRSALFGWYSAFAAIFRDNPQTRIYYILEISSVLFAAVSSLLLLKKYPILSLFGGGIIIISIFSGQMQSFIRYMIPVPAVYGLLGKGSGNKIFSRGWTMASLLLFGMLTTLYTADMWVG